MRSGRAVLALVLAGACGEHGATPPDAPRGTDARADGPPPSDRFSFFVTSLRALRELSGNPLGFGGDLRFGETGRGAGLRGADKLCATIAERSQRGAGQKPWRAFLSVTDGGDGQPVHAIERIGTGPWFDRIGRMLAPDLVSLADERPRGGSPLIADDFPNEDGVPNHDPDGTGLVDNHDMLTGSDGDGRLEAADRTCRDWTANAGNIALEGMPRVGHSWPRPPPDLAPSSINSWMSSLVESGCAPGINLLDNGPPDPNSNTVGSGGGYGGFYCFSLVP